ncbi:MAG: hypothetical protein ACRD3C_09370 [Vicinamibacterales bacterium]
MRITMGTMTFGFAARAAGVFAVVFSASFALLHVPRDPPRANIRWTADVTPATQAALERQYGLTDPRHEGGRTFSYALASTSTGNLRRLVQDRSVEDTHKIDRTRFQPILEDAGQPFGLPWWVMWSALLGIAAVLAVEWLARSRLLRVGCLHVAAAVRAVVARMSSPASRFAAVMTRGVPELPAEALGLFRIFFGASLFVALKGIPLETVAGHVPDDGQLGWRWLGWLASRPDLMALLETTIFSLLLLFVLGLFTRIAYLLAATGVVVWILVWIESQHSNAHPWVVLIPTVICLVPVRWDTAFSLDETLRRWRGRGHGARLRGKSYGFAVWIPGLVLGSIWATAAYAKIEQSGVEWILSGAVKYHWVIDAHGAVVDWAQWVASHHSVAVFLSFCGVFFESVFILAVFARSDRWRMTFAASGLALFAGFYLFQGLVWLAWYVVFVSFVVPWARVYAFLESRVPVRVSAVDTSTPSGLRTARFRHGLDWFNRLRFVDAHHGGSQELFVQPRPRTGHGLAPSHWLLIAAVLVHAILLLPAGFGRFESYSDTYSSTDEFDRVNPMKRVYRVWVRYGTADAVEVNSYVGVDVILRLTRHEALPPHYADQLRHLEALDRVPRGEPSRLTLTQEQRTFDWRNGRFNPPEARVTGILDLDSMTLVTDAGTGLN